jgi:superfamily II DNA/RNA helicase
MKFSELGLNDTLIEAIGYMNYEEATPIQAQGIPLILEGHDLIGCAQTGTGKTAAFTLPVLHKMALSSTKGTKCLILCPTRELAMQIDQLVQGLSYFTNLACYPVYGGGTGPEWEKERKALSGGADMIIATPGRLLAHMNNGYVDFSKVEHLILDEADRMLDIGFHDDIIRIIKEMPKQRQSLMFSATMAPKIRNLAKEILKEPKEINLSISKPAAGVTQRTYLAFDEQKTGLVRNIINQHPDFKSIIIFCSTKKKVDQLARHLKGKGHNVAGISSDYEQSEREKVILDFKSRRTRIVVATDVLSRGIDIKDIDLVINHDVPGDAEDYVHRVGRTARAASKGLAITLISDKDMFKFSRIEELIESQLEKLSPPEELGKGPEWRVSKGGGGNPRNKKPFNRKGKRPQNKGSRNENSSRKPDNRNASK